MAANTNTTTTTIKPFTLVSPPGKDIWRKPPSTNVFTAPTHPSTIPTYPLSSFSRARLSFTLPPASRLRQYDQAGLLLHLTNPSVPAEQSKWIKMGIEWYNDFPYLSTVGCDAWADWSIVPLPGYSSANGTEARPAATIEAVREGDALGKSLWVYAIVQADGGKEERIPLREVNWMFAEEDGWSVGVGGMVARPNEEDGELVAEFSEGLKIDVLEA